MLLNKIPVKIVYIYNLKLVEILTFVWYIAIFRNIFVRFNFI